MNREDIIRMAREADLVAWLPNSSFSDGIWWIEAHEVGSELERFAALVASAEREACADVCISLANRWLQMGAWGSNTEFDQCSEAIRARGQA